MGPEGAPVLARAQAFGFPSALTRGRGKAASRHAFGNVFGRIEAAEMRADDLFGRVSLDALRAGVPAGHIALRVQHVDGVVGDALDQQTELLLAATQRLFRRLALRQIARDFRVADDGALGRADRVDHHVRPEPCAVLAHAPPLAFEAPFGRGELQGEFRDALPAFFFGVEFRKVAPDDLLGGIALEARRARVPARHDARGVQHVDGIVRDRIDQEPIAAVLAC